MLNLYKYVLEVINKIAWIDKAAEVVGDTRHWFVHPAGAIRLIKDKYTECACERDITIDELAQIAPKIDKKKL